MIGWLGEMGRRDVCELTNERTSDVKGMADGGGRRASARARSSGDSPDGINNVFITLDTVVMNQSPGKPGRRILVV